LADVLIALAAAGPIAAQGTPASRSGDWSKGDLQENMFGQRWISGFLRRRNGRWEIWEQGTARGIIFGSTEAWWTEDCRGLQRLMPETCRP
jgi:hypothetical protein